MGYQALLFCPDERTARTVTQVLSELEFSVEAATEPFAAVKKLMGQHFDAVVVDCDNEQNAALLFKSARNSASNQAALAVAVVEGQAGVAKAFRIGANLVLTKPINIEQAKGTLRVARGLLRKGEPAKPGTPATAAPAAITAPSVTTNSSVPLKPAPRPPLGAPVVAQRPTASPTSSQASAKAVTAASSAPAAQNDVPPATIAAPKINIEKPVATPLPKPAAIATATKVPPSVSVAETKQSFKPTPSAPAFSTGAASAPAPAREAQPDESADTSSAAEVTQPAAGASAVPEPSFTFGGANVPETSGGFKKFLIPVAAIVLVGAAYAGWTYFGGHANHAASPAPAPVATTAAKSTAAPPPVTVPAPATAPTAAAAPSATTAPSPAPVNTTADSNESAEENTAISSRKSESASQPAPKAATKTAAQPLMVKGGTAPKAHSKIDAGDAAAPSIGIAIPTASGPPAGLLGGGSSGPAPVLQTLNISQGVSQGLLYKKVAPVYPPTAVAMRIEGQVELKATVSRTGNITAVKVLSGNPNLTKAAVDAVKQWKYKPYLLNGEPVEIQTQVTINFKLPN